MTLTRDRQLGFATAVSVLTGLAGQAVLMISGPLVARMLGADGRGQPGCAGPLAHS